MTLAWFDSPFLKPLPSAGLFFRRRALDTWAKVPANHRLYGASWYGTDETTMTGTHCHVIAALTGTRRLLLLDVWHDRTTLDQAWLALCDMHDAEWSADLKKAHDPRRGVRYGVQKWLASADQWVEGLQAAHGATRRARVDKINDPTHNDPVPLDPAVGLVAGLPSFDRLAGGLQAAIEAKRLVLPPDFAELKNMADLVAELVQWPSIDTAARVGALALLVSQLERLASPSGRRHEPHRAPSAWSA